MRAILLLLLFAALNTAGQSNLALSASVNGFPDTTTFGDSATITFYIKNYGPAVYSGKVYLHFGTSDTSGIQVNISDSVTASSLIPGDSVSVTIKETFSQARYKAGTNVVVIWPQPASGSASTLDTLFKNLYIIPSSIEEHGAVHFRLYPNPADDKILLIHEGNTAEYTVYDLSGHQWTVHSRNNELDISALPPGYYIIQVTRPLMKPFRKPFIKMYLNR